MTVEVAGKADSEGRARWPRVILAVLCFVGFSVTLPPLGFLMFLEFTGICDKKSMTQFVAWITPGQDWVMAMVILGFGLLAFFSVKARDGWTYRWLALVLVGLAVTSLGGCVMGLANLRGIGS